MLSLVPTLLVTPVAYALLDGLAVRLRVGRRAPAPAVIPLEADREAEADPQLVA